MTFPLCRTVSPFYRISYMWYSFMGVVLTILFGWLISMLYDHIASSQIKNLNAAQHLDIEKPPASNAESFRKDSEPVYIVEKYRKSSLQGRHGTAHLKGYDNAAME